VGELDKVSVRKRRRRCTLRPGVQTPWRALLVGHTPALAPLWRQTPCWRGNPGGWLRDVYVDIGIGPIFLSAKGE